MEYNFGTLIVLAEVTTAFVAFSAIIASIRVTFGEALTKFQNLLVHFFTESGMLGVSVCLLPMVLWQFNQNEYWVAVWTTWYTVVVASTYLVFYILRRLKIDAPTPLPSALVMISYVVWLMVLVVTLTEYFWPPSLAIITAICFWSLCSSVVIFVYFLSTFMDRD